MIYKDCEGTEISLGDELTSTGFPNSDPVTCVDVDDEGISLKHKIRTDIPWKLSYKAMRSSMWKISKKKGDES